MVDESDAAMRETDAPAAGSTPVSQPQPDSPGESAAGSARHPFLPDWYDTSTIDAAFDAVPTIGKKKWTRWYDGPHLLLGWALNSRRANLLPRQLRNRLGVWSQNLIQRNDHDRHKVWRRTDPGHNVLVPGDEHVAVPALWVVELFPPSVATELDAVMRKHRPIMFSGGDESDAAERLAETRAGQGNDWSVLASVDREPSPSQFGIIALTSIQLGTGLTAIIAKFNLTADAAASLDAEWHRQHEPRLYRRGKHLYAENRKFSAFAETQRMRRRPHDAARQWMAKNFRGVFAQAGEPQPLMDLLILDGDYNPTGDEISDRAGSDALRALGITDLNPVTMSPVVPELALTRTSMGLSPDMGTRCTWALWGNRAATAAARPEVTRHRGIHENQALAHAVDDEIRNVLLALSITEAVRLLQRQYTRVRDSARLQHDSFSPDFVDDLRTTLLTVSIDISSTSTDVKAWWERHRGSTPPFYLLYRNEDNNEPFELTDHWRTQQATDLAQLREDDARLRDILSTAASLGAATDAYKLGRVALYVAGASLIVAAVTLLFTSVADNSVAAWAGVHLHNLWNFISSHVSSWV